MDIGFKIKELRQYKKVTQEELANAVGISTQAVSKWENGGTPDINLLPQIADYFEITIDELFNRNISNFRSFEQKFSDYIANVDNKNIFMKVFEMCWNMQKSMMSNNDINDETIQMFLDSEEGTNSKMLTKYGYCLMRIHKDNMFYFIAPQPQSGNYNKIIESKEQQIDFLNFISSEDVYDILVLLNKRENSYFTPNYFVGNGITEERAKEIIDSLVQFGFLNQDTVQIDDKKQDIYVYKNTAELIVLFTALDLIVKRQNHYCYYTGGDNKYFS